MTVATSFLAIHGVLLEHTIEHVGAVDLAGQITIVAGIVTTNEVTERSLTMTPRADWVISIM